MDSQTVYYFSQTSKYFQEQINKNQNLWIELYQQKIKKKLKISKNIQFDFREIFIQRFYKLSSIFEHIKQTNYPSDPKDDQIDYDEIWNFFERIEMKQI